ncbi:MAG TPA: translocation/assembly module TamB domain-containing protein [Usitatibacter sp.]|nr:translocation/assembly module TamB domain-containing protein [Usitatibacter sp.]
MSAEAPVPAPPAAPPPRRRMRWVWRTLAAVALLLLVVIGAITWVMTTPEGARLVLGRVSTMLGEGTQFSGVDGRIGGLLRIDTIEISRPDLYVRVEGFEMDTEPLEPLHGRLLVHRLAARSVVVRTASTGEAARIPVSFKPPYAVDVEDGRVGELRIGPLTPEARAEKDVVKRRALMEGTRDRDFVVRDILLRGEGDASRWTIHEARAETTYGRAALAGTLETTAPFALDAKARGEGSFGERPYAVELRAKGTLKRLDATFEGDVSGQHAEGRAGIEPFAKMPVRTLEVTAKELDLARIAGSLHTNLDVQAKLDSEGQAFSGPVRIENHVPGPWDKGRLPFNAASARVVLTPERVDVADLSVTLPGGGAASGHAVVQKSGVEANLRVADVDLLALHGSLQKTRISGRVNVAGTREAQRFEVALKDPRFQVEGRAALEGPRLTIATVRVQTGGGAVTASGQVQLDGPRAFALEGRADHFDPSAFVKTTAGDLNFRFNAKGTMGDGIAGEISTDIAPSRYAGLPVSGRIRAAGDKSRLAASDVHMQVGDGRIDATGSFGGRGDALDVTLHAPNLSLLARPFGIAMAGRLDAQAHLTGTFRAPAGRVDATGGDLVLPSDVFIRELALKGEAGTEPQSPIDVRLDVKGLAVGKDKPPTTLAQSATATLRGTRAAHRLELDAAMNADTTVKAALQGGLDPASPSLAWNGRVESLSMTGRGAFSLQAPATLQLAAERIELGDATLRGEWGEAHLALTRWTPRTLDLRGSSPGIRIRNLAREFKLGDVPRSNLVLAADWNLRGAQTLDGVVILRRISGDVRIGEPPLPLGLTDLDLRLESSGGKARAALVLAGQRIGRIQGQGSATVERGTAGWALAPTQPVEARVTAGIPDLAVLAPWIGQDAKVTGRLDANIAVSGTGANPQVSGEAQMQNLALREPQSGFEVQQGQVALRLADNNVTIERFSAVAPWHVPPRAQRKFEGLSHPDAGAITAEGSIDLNQRRGNLRIRADHVPVTQIATRFVAVSGEARFEAAGEGVVAVGAFSADAGWIGALSDAPPSVSEDVVVVRKAAPAANAPAKGKEKITLDVRFTLGEHVYFEGRGLDTRLAGELRVQGEPTSLRASGVIRTLGGTYEGYGQKLTIERGALAFNGPIDNPHLDVRAVRKGLPVEAGVEVVGTVARPRVRLVSTPEVPEPEKLSWLVLGRGPSDLGPGDASLLLSAAASMLGKGNGGTDFTQKLGIDEVKIGRSDTHSILGVMPQSTVAGRTGTASAADVVTVGKTLTRTVHLSYEQGLSDAEGALRLTLQISKQFQLLVRAGYLPGLDAVYRWVLD